MIKCKNNFDTKLRNKFYGKNQNYTQKGKKIQIITYIALGFHFQKDKTINGIMVLLVFCATYGFDIEELQFLSLSASKHTKPAKYVHNNPKDTSLQRQYSQ